MKPKRLEDKINIILSVRQRLQSLLQQKASLKPDLEAQKTTFSIHQVIIDSQSAGLDAMQQRINYLEKQLEFETAVYESLKSICLSLTIDEENLHVLSMGSFECDDDLVKMEASLKILSEFSRRNYDLQIVKERVAEIHTALSNFFKRFVMFLSKLFVQSESSSELKVHRSFYEKMSKYKFIYKFCRAHSDYYNALCVSYVRKSKDLYGFEFKNHLNRISELIKDASTLRYSLDTLIMTYSSLLGCENEMVVLLEIDANTRDIFVGADGMICDFIDLFFKKLPHCVLAALHAYTTEENLEKLGSLGTALVEKRDLLGHVFLQQQRTHAMALDTVDLLNTLSKMKINSDVVSSLTKLVVERALDKKAKVLDGIKGLQLLMALETLDNRSEMIEKAEEMLTPGILDRVFAGDDEAAAINELRNSVDLGGSASSDVLAFIKKVLLENCEESKKNVLLRILSENTHA